MSEPKTKETVQEQVTAEANKEQVSPELTVQDLQALRQIIDVASQRGAFKANEMAVVGNIYNKLDSFLNAVSQQASAQSSAKGE